MKKIFLLLVLFSAACFGQTEFNAIKLKNAPTTINDTLQVDVLVREKSGTNKGMVRKTSWQYLLSLFKVPSLAEVLSTGNSSNEGIHLHSDLEGMSYYHAGLSYNSALSNKFSHIRFKTPVANTTYYWPAKAVNDTVAMIGDVRSSSSKYIPLSGTLPGSPVTGDIQLSGNRKFKNGTASQYSSIEVNDTGLSSLSLKDSVYSSQYMWPSMINNFVYAPNSNSSFSMGPGGVSINTYGDGSTGGLSVNPDKITVDSSNPNFRGLSGNQDYTGNITSFDYVQKKYVDEAIGAATPSALNHLPYTGAVADLNMGVGRKIKTDIIEATISDDYGRIRFYQANLPGTTIDCNSGSSFGAVLTVNNRATYNSPNLQFWQVGGTNVAYLTPTGRFYGSGLYNLTSSNSSLSLNSTGSVISRSNSSTGVALTVENTLTSSSNVMEVKSGGSTVFTISPTGLPSFSGASGTSGNNLVKYSQFQTVIQTIVAITASTSFAITNYNYVYSFTGSTTSTGTLPALNTTNKGRSYTIINSGTVPFTINSNTGGNDIRFRGADYASFIIQPGGQATFILDATKAIVYEPVGISNIITNGDTYSAVTSGAVHAALNSKADKTGTADIEITDPAKGIILRSPNGSRWRTTISNSGVLTTVLIP